MAEALDAGGVTVHPVEDGTEGRPDAVFPDDGLCRPTRAATSPRSMVPASRRRECRDGLVEVLTDRRRIRDAIDPSGLERDGVVPGRTAAWRSTTSSGPGQPEASSRRHGVWHADVLRGRLRPAMPQRKAFIGLVLAATAFGLAAAHAAGTAPEAAPPAAARIAPPAAPASEAQRFCQNVAAAAADARFSLQTRKLNELEDGIAKRVAALEAKEAEVKAVLAEHEDARRRAEASLVAIYAKMRPDAAAAQIAALDDGTAAAVLRALSARQSSAILNEIPAERAVKLVNAIAGLVPAPDKPAPDRRS